MTMMQQIAQIRGVSKKLVVSYQENSLLRQGHDFKVIFCTLKSILMHPLQLQKTNIFWSFSSASVLLLLNVHLHFTFSVEIILIV